MAVVTIIAPTILRATFHQTLANNRTSDNVFDISVDGQGVIDRDTVLADLLSHLTGFWQDSGLHAYSVNSHFTGASFVDLDSPDGATGSLGPNPAKQLIGNVTGSVCPPNVSSLTTKVTISRRGEKQGRTYIPDVPEAQTGDNGSLSSAHQVLVHDSLEAFRTKLGTYEFVPASGINPVAMRVVHVHKPDTSVPSTWTWTSSTVDSLITDDFCATQRRRLR